MKPHKFYIRVFSLLSAFILAWVISKSATTATLKQQEIEMVFLKVMLCTFNYIPYLLRLMRMNPR